MSRFRNLMLLVEHPAVTRRGQYPKLNLSRVNAKGQAPRPGLLALAIMPPRGAASE
jgi:hypothetical protein